MSATRITRSAAVAIGALAIAAPSAGAMISPPDAADPTVLYGTSDAAQRSSGETNAGGIVSDPAPRTVVFADDGFDWGDAALGAGTSVLVLTLLGAGGIAVSRRHHAPLAS
jgi:hypothetical protein